MKVDIAKRLMECMPCHPVILGSFKNITNNILGKMKDYNGKERRHGGKKIKETKQISPPNSFKLPLVDSDFC
jgi:hypothetical protein